MRQRPSGRKVPDTEKRVLLTLFLQHKRAQLNDVIEEYLSTDKDAREVCAAYGIRENSLNVAISRLRKRAKGIQGEQT